MIYSVADSTGGSREERWYVMAVHGVERPGRRQRVLRAVDGTGATMATVGFDGPEHEARAEVTVDIAPATEAELAAQLLSRLTDVARQTGVTTLTVDLDCRRSIVAEVLVRSGLAWRLRSAGSATRAELDLEASQDDADLGRGAAVASAAAGTRTRTGFAGGAGGGNRRRAALRWQGGTHSWVAGLAPERA